MTSLAGQGNPHGGRNLWSIDEYIVVADLYLRRRRSSGVRDPDVLEIAKLTGRSPASISRRLGNFDGTVRPGMGLKPVTGDALTVFESMRENPVIRAQFVDAARRRLMSNATAQEASRQADPEFVDPENLLTPVSDVVPPIDTRILVRKEAKLVACYRRWLDPELDRLRGLLIPAGGQVLRADLFDTRLNLLIEAKADCSREHIRYAIGQLLDYRRYLNIRPQLAVLLPDLPAADMLRLLNDICIVAIWQDGDSFADSADGGWTLRHHS